jgi:ribonuclease G
MKRCIAISSTPAETRVAITEDDSLAELFVERSERDRLLGTILPGRVVKVVDSMFAAFVDVGFDSDGFLPLSDWRGNLLAEISSASLRTPRSRPQRGERQRSPVKIGDIIPVQVVKEPISAKGARLTMQLSFPGRYMVLLPGERTMGVSRRIASQNERKRLKQIAHKLRPDGFGVIIRTVAEGHTEKQLSDDLNDLLSAWNKAKSALRQEKVGKIAHREPGMVSSVMRDLFTSDVDRVICDNRAISHELGSFVKEVLPALKDRVEYYNSHEPLFDHLGLEEEVEKIFQRRVWFRGGGYLIIDHTEAMITIDVNSGRSNRNRNVESAALRVNLEAAREACRQLRLRDIGGLVVVDFIDMFDVANRERVQLEMRTLLKLDRAQADIAPISRFGLLEMTRERVRPALIHTLQKPCHRCFGTGLVPSFESLASEIERWAKRYKADTKRRRLQIHVSPSLYDFLTHGRGSLIRRMMLRNFMHLRLFPDETMDEVNFRCFAGKNQPEITEKYSRGLAGKN